MHRHVDVAGEARRLHAQNVTESALDSPHPGCGKRIDDLELDIAAGALRHHSQHPRQRALSCRDRSDLVGLSAGEGRDGSSFAEAVTAYEDGRFDEARAQFHELLLGGHHDGVLLFNLGNSSYRSGRFPEAVYAFEWARRALPGDERVRENLGLARAQLIVDELPSDLAPAARAALERARSLPLAPLALNT